MKDSYLDIVARIERMHRLFLEVIRNELDRLGIHDINNIQALVLYNIGKNQLTVGELTNRGYYLGSNVSYNLRKMTQNDYLKQESSPHDKRATIVKLSSKGLDLYKKVDVLLSKQATSLSNQGVDEKNLLEVADFFRRLEGFWTHILTTR